MATPEISILILAKNEERNIGRCLEQVFSQVTTRKYEVVIVDSGSTDGTLSIAARFPARQYRIKPEEFSHSRTRNYAAGLAVGRYLVFLAADAIPTDHTWLANLIQPLDASDDIGAVYGRQYPAKNAIPIHRFRLQWLYGNTPTVKCYATSPRNRSLFFFSTVNCAIRKKVWEAFRFDPQLPIFEDTDFARRILRAGTHIFYTPLAAVYHSHNIGAIGTFKRYFDVGLVHSKSGIADDMTEGMSGEGLKFVTLEFLFLLRSGNVLSVPYAFLHNIAKATGMIVGRHGEHLPKSLTRRLSLQYFRT